jgi:uncharacterized protein
MYLAYSITPFSARRSPAVGLGGETSTRPSEPNILGSHFHGGCDVSNGAGYDLGSGAAPLAPDERIHALDALRGLALFGVLAINLETEFRVSIFQAFIASSPDRGLGRLVDAGLEILVDLKAFAVFSLLFGIGLAIQHQRLEHHPRRAVLLIRRLLALLAIGLLHLFLIWNGDILTEYALAGLLALPFLFAPTWLLAGASAAFFALYLAMPVLPSIASFPTHAWMVDHVQAANRIYGSGDYGQILQFSIEEISAMLPLHVRIFPRTLALFLFGAVMWKAGVVPEAERHQRLLLSSSALCIVAGLLGTLATSAREYSGWPSLGRIAIFVWPAATILLALGYVNLVIVISLNGRRWIAWAEPIGRMAFTNYIVQSLLLGWVFYGYGLGWFGRLGPVAGLGLVVLIYAVQAMYSQWWLDRFRYGPIEWFWRALMYGHRPAFVRVPDRMPA